MGVSLRTSTICIANLFHPGECLESGILHTRLSKGDYMEMKKTGAKQTETLKKVLHYIQKYWIYLVLSIVAAAVTVALTLYLPILTGNAIDLILAKGLVDFPGIFAILQKMAVVILITAFAQWLMNVCNNKMAYRIVQDIRNEAFHKIEILPLIYRRAFLWGDREPRYRGCGPVR